MTASSNFGCGGAASGGGEGGGRGSSVIAISSVTPQHSSPDFIIAASVASLEAKPTKAHLESSSSVSDGTGLNSKRSIDPQDSKNVLNSSSEASAVKHETRTTREGAGSAKEAAGIGSDAGASATAGVLPLAIGLSSLPGGWKGLPFPFPFAKD